MIEKNQFNTECSQNKFAIWYKLVNLIHKTIKKIKK